MREPGFSLPSGDRKTQSNSYEDLEAGAPRKIDQLVILLDLHESP